jgi:hypothetical protein
LERNLSEHASLADAPGKGRPLKYTPEVLGEAWGYMKELDGAWSSTDFVSYLIEMGTLVEGNSLSWQRPWQRYSVSRSSAPAGHPHHGQLFIIPCP